MAGTAGFIRIPSTICSVVEHESGTQVGTGLTLKLVSSSKGLYSAQSLPVGKYSISVTAPGFATAGQEVRCYNLESRCGVPMNL
jgi:hypothetical protein